MLSEFLLSHLIKFVSYSWLQQIAEETNAQDIILKVAFGGKYSPVRMENGIARRAIQSTPHAKNHLNFSTCPMTTGFHPFFQTPILVGYDFKHLATCFSVEMYLLHCMKIRCIPSLKKKRRTGELKVNWWYHGTFHTFPSNFSCLEQRSRSNEIGIREGVDNGGQEMYYVEIKPLKHSHFFVFFWKYSRFSWRYR